MKAIEYNVQTGITSERELTPEEIAHMEVEANYKPSNKEIKAMRQQAYKDRSDSLYLAWQKYLNTEDERAPEAKQLWLDEVTKIDAELPYNE